MCSIANIGVKCYDMQMTELLLVRHAEGTHMSEANKDFVSGHATMAVLTDNGFAQAEHAGKHIKGLGYTFARVDTSPLRRTRQTSRATLVAMGELATVPRSDFRLAEQCLGSNEGRLRSEVYTPAVKASLAAKGADYRHPGKNEAGKMGESLSGAVRRILDYVSETHYESNGEARIVLAVSHQTIIRGLAAELALRDGFIHDQPVGGTDLRDAFHDMPAIGPCAGSLLVVEDCQSDSLRGHFKYIGENPLPDQ